MSIAVSGSDLFVASVDGTIGEYTTAGATVNASLIPGLLLGVTGVVVDGSDLFVTNFEGTIGEYTTAGATVNADLISLSSVLVTGIAVSGSDLFVLNAGAGTIGEYTTAGGDGERRADLGVERGHCWHHNRRQPLAVPEPSTWAMMLLGVAGLGFAGYGRARAGHATLAT